jgi:hypothetical protein
MNEIIELRPTIGGKELPVACQLDAIPVAIRAEHFTLTERLFTELVRERNMEDDGLHCRFDADAFGDVAAFVANERLCCAFFTFTITVTPAGGPVWLTLSGDTEIIASIFALPAHSASTVENKAEEAQ